MSPADDRPPIDSAFAAARLTGGALDPTYAGALSFMRRRYTKDVVGADVAILGVPLDIAVTNRPGARFGPQAIRRASAIFDGDPQYPFGVDIFERMAVVDAGDVDLPLHHPERITDAIDAAATAIIEAGVHLFALGGDHYVTWPLLRATARRHGPLALIQFDAHQDTWPDDGVKLSHGSFVARAVNEGVIDPARSIQIGVRTLAPETCGIAIVHAGDLAEMRRDAIVAAIAERVGEGAAYLTFDIDCLDPAFAPGTGTPVAGGPSSREMLRVLAGLGGVRFVGGDVVEVSPPYDHADITAIAAATVAQHYLGLLATTRFARP